ncbi:unnamed protein product [Cuscuta epithymum]|uniref:Arabinanase/levansucrase/invertase n=1 Tax=Cuscuta epithymum TaxID=186058 RepID=A0AAV0F0E6_9ASTE|nr:unnamed protein product [Cuscuta epithymum]
MKVSTLASLSTTTSIPNTPFLQKQKPIDFGKNKVGHFSISTTESKQNFPFLPRCSAKPHATDEGLLSVQPDSRSRPEGEPKPVTGNQIGFSPGPLISRGLVFDLGSASSWDGVEIGSPVVKRYLGDEEERWYLWYHGRSGKNPGSDSIGLAVSSNGAHWERGEGGVRSGGDVGMVMSCSEDWWGFDTESLMPSEVVIMSSNKVNRSNTAVYWLYYTGFSSQAVDFSAGNSLGFCLENPERAYLGNGNKSLTSGAKQGVMKSLPGLAISQDGRHWARIEGEHHSGALFDAGQEGDWDSLFIASPHVIYHGNGDLRMYYHSFDAENGCFAIGMARSRDGIKWVKQGRMIGEGGVGAFDELGVMNPNVVRNRKDGRYIMAYEGVGVDGRRSIGVAISPDGLKGWRRVVGCNPVLRGCEGGDGWDCEGVGSPCLVQMDGEDEVGQWRLYYRGVGRGGRTGIGMAVSNGRDFHNFQRWTGFHL